MTILFFTGSAEAYMRPPSLSNEMVIAGPDWADATHEDGKLVSLKTPLGSFSVKGVISKIPPEQSPDVLVCLVDATKRCLPQDLAFFKGPKILLLADTHHLKSPISSMIRYARSEPFDRIVLLYDRHHADFFYAAGFRNLFWFPSLTFPHSDKWVAESRNVRSRSATIGFVGQAAAHHPRRKRLLEALTRAGLPLVQKSIPQSESLGFYASSLVGLNASLNGDLNLRFFEILASGSLLMTDALTSESGIDCIRSGGCAFEEYRNEEELLAKARHFLGHPREAFELAKQGKEWFQNHFREELRRAMFQRIVFDGVSPEIFPLPRRENFFFLKSQKGGSEAVTVYELVQELHRIKESVRIGHFGVVSQGIERMFNTLPRIEMVEVASEFKGDLILGEHSRAAEALALQPPAVWFPDLEGLNFSAQRDLFSKAGYSVKEHCEAFFQLVADGQESLAEVETLCAEAARFFRSGDIGRSFDLARQAFGMNQRSIEAAKLMADALLQIGGRPGDAEKLLLHALGLNFNDAEIRPALAEACFQARQMEKAMEWVRESIARNPENLRAMRVLAKIHEVENNLGAALETIEIALSTHPNCIESKAEYAMLLRKAGRTHAGLNMQLQMAGAVGLSSIDPSKKAVRVAFLVQHPQGWTNFESVRDAMLKDPRFEVIVISAPYLHPYPPEGGPEAIYSFLDKRGISHRRWDSGILKPNFADVLFVQNPYAVTRPGPLRLTSLMKFVPRLAYIPYGLEIGGGHENTRNQFNLELQQRAWLIFARSIRHKHMFARHCGSGDSHVVVTGHPKIDPLINLEKNADPEITAFAGARKVFLWNPQFDIRPDGTGFSTFLTWNEFLIREFHERADACLIIRPHPLFFGSLESRKIWDRQRVESFLRECEESPNILIDRRPGYLPVFAASSALISDASSFLLEYAITGKPILYLPNPNGPQLNQDGEFVNNYLCRGETPSCISSFINNVVADVDEKKALRMQALKEFLEVPPAGVGESIKEHILEKLGEDAAQDHQSKKSRGHDFWNNCSNTHLAESNYYIKASEALKVQINKFLKKTYNVVDFGCGAGEASLLAAPHVASVIGFDLSESLVAKASESSQKLGLNNVRFERLDMELGLPKVEADAIFCLGVFSCIQEDAIWQGLLGSFSAILKPGDILILRETLATTRPERVMYPNGYYANYRSVKDYLSITANHSFSLVEDVELFKRSDGLENHLYVFKKA